MPNDGVTGSADTDWGGFTVGPMALALPMSALREVAPCRELTPLPVASRAVPGGLELRGWTLPVLDLAARLGLAPPGRRTPNVVVLQHEGRLLAVQADTVTGVFRAQPGSRVTATAAASGRPLPFAGSIRRADTGALQTVLAIEALAALSGVPWIEDPEPARSASVAASLGAGSDAPVDAEDSAVSLLLLKAGPRAFALETSIVHSTLADPVVEPSPVSSVLVPGVVRAHGQRLAALDLTALCGLGALPASDQRQAVTVRHPRGLVVLLVERVLEIVRMTAVPRLPAPAFALPAPDLVPAVVPGHAIPEEQLVSAAHRRHDYLLVDNAALLAHPDLAALAGTAVPDGETAAAGVAHQTSDGVDGRAVITFLAPNEIAVPIDQVREILPGASAGAALAGDGLVSRLVVQQDRAIPVVRLERLLGRPFDAGADSPVLVVQTGETRVGFEVAALRSIEQAHWEQRVRPPAVTAGHGGRDAQTLVTVGSGAAARTIPLLDLTALAGTVAGGHASA